MHILKSCLCAALVATAGAHATAAGPGIVGGEVHGASRQTGLGNQNEPLLRLTLDVEGETAWSYIEIRMGGTATPDDIDRLRVYATPDDHFDSRFAAAYEPLGDCAMTPGRVSIPLSGTAKAGKNHLWLAADISQNATEGRLVEAEVARVSTADGTFSPSRDAEPPKCEIVLTRRLVFAPGDYASRNYRIPAIVTAADGTLVVATDKRKANQGDLPEDIDVVVNRSSDGGQTWSPPITVAKGQGRFKGYGDAALVRTGEEGGLLCIFVGGNGLWNSTAADPQRTYVCKSLDNGKTWGAPTDITDQLYGAGCVDPIRRNWAASFCSSGAALLGRDGTIWVVAVVRETERRSVKDLANYVYYSEDNGKTWRVSACVMKEDANEAKIVETDDGGLLVSIRNQQRGARYYSVSHDRGKTWTPVGQWQEMQEPGCNGDIIRYTSAKDGDDKSRLLHSVPNANRRRNVSVFVSYDEGKTWPVKKTIQSGGSAYSSLCRLEDGTIGIYIEENEADDYSLYFTRFSLEWLTDGKDSPTSAM